MEFINEVQLVCEQALIILKVNKLKFRAMNRKNHVNTKRGFVIGRTNLKTGLITIDIFTPKKRQPKKVSSILRILCHEVAHHQKKPYRERFKGHIINRQHYPKFYKQVNRNISILKKNVLFSKYF
ncbi:MAG: hypothetical protein ABIG60_03110 [Patescibacteria group bacterium]